MKVYTVGGREVWDARWGLGVACDPKVRRLTYYSRSVHTIVTMTRGDAERIGEWVEYHSRLGFDDFQIILDGEVDNTRQILTSLDLPVDIKVHPRPEIGEYSDGLSPSERQQQTLEWRARYSEDLAAKRMRGRDPLSWRQHQHFPDVLAPYHAGERGRGWLALIDVDEFIVLRGYESIRRVTEEAGAPRIRLLNFDVDTSRHDPARPVLEQHTRRWARADLLQNEDQRWAHRVKSIVRYRCAQLTSTVHKISAGPNVTLDPETARLHHFRIPTQPGLGIPYSVEDPVFMPSNGPMAPSVPSQTR